MNKTLLLTAIGCIIIITVFKSRFKGEIGELAVAYILRDLDKEKYKIFHDIKIKNTSNNTKTTQIDHLIISTFGVFCIETKAYKGKIIGKDFSRQWIQILSKQKNYFMNPILQNYGHIKSVESIIKDSYPDMKYFSIIGFSPEANIRDLDVKNAKVCKMSDIPNVIK